MQTEPSEFGAERGQGAFVDILLASENPTYCPRLAEAFPGYCASGCSCVVRDCQNAREAGNDLPRVIVNPRYAKCCP